MIPVIFYEKPGCVNNNKQKKSLIDFGFKVICANLLETNFSKDQLLKFFGNKNVKACINNNAPAVKNREIDIDNLTDENILEMMIKNPILIKRPLIAVGENRFCGFDINRLLNLKLEEIK